MTKRERATRRRQRTKAKVLSALDWERRNPLDMKEVERILGMRVPRNAQEAEDVFTRGTRVHQEIERVLKNRNCPFVGDYHVGMITDPPLSGLHQAAAYAVAAGLDEYAVLTVTGGDFVEHTVRVKR